MEQSDKQLEIVGMVADAKYRTLRETVEPATWVAMAQNPQVGSSVRMVIKTASSTDGGPRCGP